MIPYKQLSVGDIFLHYSKPLREFCGFTKVPDASKITRFKQDFLDDLQAVFDNLIDITEPICQAVDAAKADMTIFDSSGIEAFVTENNPKVFPGDAAFDTVQLYRDLLTGDTFGKDRHFSSAYIPLNQRVHLENTDYTTKRV